jgi:zinc transport system ATP-binding protein
MRTGSASQILRNVINAFHRDAGAAAPRWKVGMHQPDNVLEVADLSVSFGKTQVLKNLTFSVRSGMSLAIIGPNGAGKSVLLRALLGSIPFEGSIRWASGARIGYVPQKLDLERDLPMTGIDLLRARVALARASESSISRALEAVGLAGTTAGRLIGTYSGGQFQRLLIAFALLGSPTVLMLDEPTAGVDEPGQEQLNVLIQRVQHEQNLTVLFISHDFSAVYREADCVLCLGHAQAFFGPPRDILTPAILEEAYGMPLRYHLHGN